MRGVTRAPPRRPAHLDLRGQGLTAVPEWVWSLRGLETLNLSENHITSVPDEIANFSRLRMLDIGHSLAGLPKLHKLDLRWNTLSVMPNWVDDLERRGCAVLL